MVIDLSFLDLFFYFLMVVVLAPFFYGQNSDAEILLIYVRSALAKIMGR